MTQHIHNIPEEAQGKILGLLQTVWDKMKEKFTLMHQNDIIVLLNRSLRAAGIDELFPDTEQFAGVQIVDGKHINIMVRPKRIKYSMLAIGNDSKFEEFH